MINIRIIRARRKNNLELFREILGGPNLAGDGSHLASQLLKQLELC